MAIIGWEKLNYTLHAGESVYLRATVTNKVVRSSTREPAPANIKIAVSSDVGFFSPPDQTAFFQPGESKTFSFTFNIPDSALGKTGFIRVAGLAPDGSTIKAATATAGINVVGLAPWWGATGVVLGSYPIPVITLPIQDSIWHNTRVAILDIEGIGLTGTPRSYTAWIPESTDYDSGAVVPAHNQTWQAPSTLVSPIQSEYARGVVVTWQNLGIDPTLYDQQFVFWSLSLMDDAQKVFATYYQYDNFNRATFPPIGSVVQSGVKWSNIVPAPIIRVPGVVHGYLSYSVAAGAYSAYSSFGGWLDLGNVIIGDMMRP